MISFVGEVYNGDFIELVDYGISLEKTIITFIGASNMAKSLIGGLLSSGFKGNIRAFDTDPEALNTASSLGPISIYNDSYSATNGAYYSSGSKTTVYKSSM